MAGADRFVITINGKGGHAASPNLTRDPVLVSAHMITALQSIASRFTDPFDPVVVSVTFSEAGNDKALNVIPASVRLGGTIRTMQAETRKAVEQRFRDIVHGTANFSRGKPRSTGGQAIRSRSTMPAGRRPSLRRLGVLPARGE